MRHAVGLLGWLACSALASATLAGMLAPFFALLDLPNHFRPHLLIALLLCSGLAALLKMPRLLVASASFALINFALAVPPFFFMAPPAGVEQGRPFKVVFANVWGRNRDFAPLAEFLRAEKADIVLLAEADQPIARTLANLSDLYPYRADCIGSHFCRLAMLSRFPISSRIGDRSNEVPPHIVAEVDVDGRKFTVVGTHLARPYSSRWQTHEIDFLINEVSSIQGPLIMLGDFNATPWSWTMLSLQLRAGLSHHIVLGASWPAHMIVPPQLMLEQVLSRGGVRRGKTYLGPDIRSDHLPLVANVLLPASD